ncbi:MAG: methionyl-tRNA formyltransferase, partial [Atribacterota bacterium]
YIQRKGEYTFVRIIFIGTSYFGVSILEKLISLKKDIVAVVTQPDRPGGRGKRLLSSPIKRLANRTGLKLFQPEDINSDSAALEIAMLNPDLIILVAYGQILTGKILQLPTVGCLNIHPSLLPRYRGPAPINWALIKGEKETGITFLFMNEKIDAGDIILQKRINILPEDNYDKLSSRLASESANLLEEVLYSLEKGQYQRIPQQNEKYFYARKINKDDCRIDWNSAAIDVYNLVRGLTTFPGSFTEFKGKRIKISEVSLTEKIELDSNYYSKKPGSIVKLSQAGIMVITGDGNLIALKRLIPAGSKEMDASEFINGYHIKVGDSFN